MQVIKQVRLYNVIFPIWLLWLMPPVIFVTLIGNFIIDSIVILLSFSLLKAGEITGYTIKELYKKTIIKVWIFGFLADFIATLPLIAGITGLLPANLSGEIENAVAMDPFSNTWALLIILSCIMLASMFICIFNYKISFSEVVKEKALRAKLSIILAVITAPWALLIPSKLLYN